MTGKHPRLRSHTRRRANGRVVTYYFYDRRAEGLPDLPLGTDYEKAVARWRDVHERAPLIAGTLEEAFKRWEEECLPLYTNKFTKADFKKYLGKLRLAFGPCLWSDIEVKELKDYLKKRSGKTQANRELSLLSIIWNWARTEGLTRLAWPAAGMERSKWKNKEGVRRFKVTDELFAAVYPHGDQVLQDCMDLSSATAMRLTDCCDILLPRGEVLHLDASKTGKEASFDVNLSQVLPGLLERRRAVKANHLMLLSTPKGRRVSLRMLEDRWNEARRKAAQQAEDAGDAALAALIRRMWLRDMRKYSADLAPNLEAAAELLQHDDKRLTRRHYRTVAVQLKPMR
jgi:hypothetical protein